MVSAACSHTTLNAIQYYINIKPFNPCENWFNMEILSYLFSYVDKQIDLWLTFTQHICIFTQETYPISFNIKTYNNIQSFYRTGPVSHQTATCQDLDQWVCQDPIKPLVFQAGLRGGRWIQMARFESPEPGLSFYIIISILSMFKFPPMLMWHKAWTHSLNKLFLHIQIPHDWLHGSHIMHYPGATASWGYHEGTRSAASWCFCSSCHSSARVSW